MMEIVTFTQDHLEAAHGLSQAAGWPHRLEDWSIMLQHARGCVALDGDRVIGTALRADFGPDLSTLGMIIVVEDRRGQGIGRKLMTALMENRQSYRLIATASGRPLYEKLGFGETGHLLQCQGRLKTAPELGAVGPADDGDLAQIVDLDSKSFGGDRTALVSWLRQNAVLAVSRSAGHVTGFAALRAFGKGHVIGPITAPDRQVAQSLVAHLMRDLEGAFLRLDVTEDSNLAPWLASLGLAVVDRAPVMQIGDLHPSPTRMAVFSQAFG